MSLQVFVDGNDRVWSIVLSEELARFLTPSEFQVKMIWQQRYNYMVFIILVFAISINKQHLELVRLMLINLGCHCPILLHIESGRLLSTLKDLKAGSGSICLGLVVDSRAGSGSICSNRSLPLSIST